jgi:SLT domain-containing protein
MNAGGAYRGYATGGKVPHTQWAWVGEDGPELMNLPGGAEIFSHQRSKRMSPDLASSIVGSGRRKPSGGRAGDVNVYITGDNHFHNDQDMDKFTGKVKKAFEEILKDEYHEGGELTVYG